MELLVAVAIIAVLAAIALPNFLEAQVRARVARAASDMRTVAYGLELYRIDHGQLPDPLPPGAHLLSFAARLAPLTTPVAYLGSVPDDVFDRRFMNGPFPVDTASVPGGRALAYGRGDRAGERGTIDLGAQHLMVASAGPDGWLAQAHYYPPVHGLGGSDCPICGPELASILQVIVYDPTNGTISEGDLYRWTSSEVRAAD